MRRSRAAYRLTLMAGTQGKPLRRRGELGLGREQLQRVPVEDLHDVRAIDSVPAELDATLVEPDRSHAQRGQRRTIFGRSGLHDDGFAGKSQFGRLAGCGQAGAEQSRLGNHR